MLYTSCGKRVWFTDIAAPQNSIMEDKARMMTHTHPHKPQRDIKGPSAITRLTTHFTCGLMSDLVICKHKRVWSYLTPNVLTGASCH